MNRPAKTAILSGAALLLCAAVADAASDYFLKIEGVQGESSAATSPIEVQSWSFGASNPRSVGSSGSSAGRAAAPASSAVVAPRDAASGQASGRRSAAASSSGSDAVAGPVVGEVGSFSVMVRESPTLPSRGGLARACATGQHIPKVTLSGRGQTVELADVTISACPQQGEMRVYEFRGHVTLMK